MRPREGGHGPPTISEEYFARDVFFEIHFCVILQGIQNFFGPCTPRIFLGTLAVIILNSNIENCFFDESSLRSPATYPHPNLMESELHFFKIL